MEIPLHTAVKKEQIEIVSDLISRGADVNAKDKYGSTAVHLAVESKNVEILTTLLQSGADVNVVKHSGSAPIHHLFFSEKVNNDLETLSLLIQYGANVNAKLKYRELTPLHLAVSFRNNIDIVKLLVGAGANVNAECTNGDTPLHSVNDYETVKFLLQAGAKANSKNCFGYTPLHYIVESSPITLNLNVLKLLLEAGADVNGSTITEITPLHSSLLTFSLDHHIDVIKFLIDAGANVNATDWAGNTPLYSIAEDYDDIFDLHVFELLLKAGADLNKRTSDIDNTPFTLLIINLGSRINCKNKNQLMEKIKLFIEYADINVVDDNGKNIVANILKSNTLMKSRKYFYKIILQHIAKVKALNFQVDTNLLDTLSINNDYNTYFAKCKEELNRAQSTLLHNCWVTFFNLIVDDKSKFVKYAGNQNLLKDFRKSVKNFPIYKTKMESNIENGIKSRIMFDEASRMFSYHCPIFDPYHLIIRGIMEILRKEDWKQLCEKKHSVL